MSDRGRTSAYPGVSFHCALGFAVGLGHLARCSVVSEELRALGVRTSVVLRQEPPYAASYLLDRFDHQWVNPSALAEAADVAVVDGVFQTTGPGRRRDVVIDDGPPRSVDARLVVNPNLTARPDGYSTTGPGGVLAGASFAIVDGSVLAARETVPAVRDRVRRVLISCGGSDPVGMTERYVRAARAAGAGLEIRAVVGPLNKRSAVIERLAVELGATVVSGLRSLAGEAAAADIALTTLGTTAAELACLGVANVATAVTQQQVPILQEYAAAGLLVETGYHDEVDEAALVRAISAVVVDAPLRRSLRSAGRAMVDGLGARRVATEVATLAKTTAAPPQNASRLDGRLPAREPAEPEHRP